MLNNINSSTVGLNQNLGKLQETGSVGNNPTKEAVKVAPSAVWEGIDDNAKPGDVCIVYIDDENGNPQRQVIRITSKNPDGTGKYAVIKGGQEAEDAAIERALEEDRGHIRK